MTIRENAPVALLSGREQEVPGDFVLASLHTLHS